MPFNLVTVVKIIFSVAAVAFTVLFFGVITIPGVSFAGAVFAFIVYFGLSVGLYFWFLEARKYALRKMESEPDYDGYGKKRG